MSGGSFDYIGIWGGDVEELAKRTQQIQYMADLLESLDDGKLAARHTRDVLRLLTGVERLSRQLYDVWHDVEWWKSGDYSGAQAHEALAAYNAAHGGEGDQVLSDAVGQQP